MVDMEKIDRFEKMMETELKKEWRKFTSTSEILKETIGIIENADFYFEGNPRIHLNDFEIYTNSDTIEIIYKQNSFLKLKYRQNPISKIIRFK